MTIDVLTTVYIGNAIGIALLLVLIFSNRSRFSQNKDTRMLMKLLLICIMACLADPIVYTVDGRSGIVHTIIIYVGNSWLYMANMLTGIYWVRFLISHLGLKMSTIRKNIYIGVFCFGCLCLIINLFYPIIFSVEGNVYQRTFLYPMYVLIAGLSMLDSIVIYFRAKKKGGVLTFFPIYVFLVPIVVGVTVQSLFYGISVIWASVSIALAGIMTALKNEVIYTDPLTGLYNRFFLEQLQKSMIMQKEVYITGIMADLNGFKSINDRFGHATGDEALIIAAELFDEAVGEYGTVTRYAGDEFVILLNFVDENRVNSVVESIQSAFDNFNAKSKKPYKLSVSMGYSALDLKYQNINEFMNTIDMKMYESKMAYYRSVSHDRRNR